MSSSENSFSHSRSESRKRRRKSESRSNPDQKRRSHHESSRQSRADADKKAEKKVRDISDPEYVQENFNIIYMKNDGRLEMEEMETFQIAEILTDFVADNVGERNKLLKDIQQMLTFDEQLKNFESCMPGNVDHLLKRDMKAPRELFILDDTHSAQPKRRGDSILWRIIYNIQALWSNRGVQPQDKVRMIIENYLRLWSKLRTKSEDTQAKYEEYFGENYAGEVGKSLLMTLCNFADCKISANDECRLLLETPQKKQDKCKNAKCDLAVLSIADVKVVEEGNMSKIHPNLVKMLPFIRIGVGVFGGSLVDDKNKSPVVEDIDHQYEESLGDSRKHNRSSTSAERDFKQSPIHYCPSAMREKGVEKVRNYLYSQHIVQLLGCGQNTMDYLCHYNRGFGNEDTLGIIGIFIIKTRAYFTRLEATCNYWETSIVRGLDFDTSESAKFTVSDWYLNLANTRHISVLVAFLKYYPKCYMNMPI